MLIKEIYRIKHICNGSQTEDECNDEDSDVTNELRDWLDNNDIISTDDRDKYYVGNGLIKIESHIVKN